MGAFVDRSVHCIIKLDGHSRMAGAFPMGNPYFSEPGKGQVIAKEGVKTRLNGHNPDRVKTWLICNHLDTPEKFISNYAKHHYFVVFDSHVFCHDCNENNMRDGESAFLNMELASSALTDNELQHQIFDPFYNLNLRHDTLRMIQGNGPTQFKSWRVCSHLANEVNFRRHVFDGNLILFTDNNVTCPDCLDSMLKKSGKDHDDNMILLPENEFQYAIVDLLYSLNYELSLAQGFIH
ncbi:MAG: hypothetical protein ACR2PH_00140 [Desulfobulbia bacterium]